MKAQAFPVSTKVLWDQGETTGREIVAHPERARAVAKFGFTAEDVDALKRETAALIAADVTQERAKVLVSSEAREDRELAEKGYRWKLALDSCVRAHQAKHDDEDLAQAFRFGKLKSASARAVLFELRFALPEAEARAGVLASVGVDAAFLREGHEILAALSSNKQESESAAKARKEATVEVDKRELSVSRLLAQLVAADEAHCLRTPGEGPVFRLDLVRAEMARLEAARASRLAASSKTDTSDDD